MNNSFKTSKGTELPLMNLKGKPYLQVAHRLVWFREEHSKASIKTECLYQDKDKAIFKAEIYGEDKSLLASGHGQESIADFKDFFEKAETKAIGRALAMVGYGTQFAPELDEGERLADSPISRAKSAAKQGKTPQEEALTEAQVKVAQKKITKPEILNMLKSSSTSVTEAVLALSAEQAKQFLTVLKGMK